MDLFNQPSKKKSARASYNASDIEVLEGLEPVRRRPGMYIGGTDDNALHHLVSEIFDNSMDEVVAKHATYIEIEVKTGNKITISDNGRGIPTDPHPKFPDKSALEIILTTLHSGGKFSNKIYETSGGLHGVGLSVVNALSESLEISVVRDCQKWSQNYAKGAAVTKLLLQGSVKKKQGTIITFKPDPEIFGNLLFKSKRLYQLVKAKAYLFKGVEVRWSCDPALISNKDIPVKEKICFPGGLHDFLNAHLTPDIAAIDIIFTGNIEFSNNAGKIEWAIGWTNEEEGFLRSYCNTIPTPLGGTHEVGFRTAIVRGLKQYGEMINNKRAAQLTYEDIFESAYVILSLFIPEPQFQGQTKEKLVNHGVNKVIENALKDYFDHWLVNHNKQAEILLNFVLEKMEARLRKKNQKEISRKSLTQKLRLPGKLTDCTRDAPQGTELFLVEGDSAGGSAKQARNRETQAVLPLRGKILNVVSNSADKINQNQELNDLELALGCGTFENYCEENLRYDKIIIMTDADVDGSHIASLLMTYFFRSMPKLVSNGHLYLAKPPLYRLIQSNKVYYAQNDVQKEKLAKQLGKSRATIEYGRFKGLGEMTAAQLKETTMNPATRTLIKITMPDPIEFVAEHVENLMGKKPELRLKFIQQQTLSNPDIKAQLDI